MATEQTNDYTIPSDPAERERFGKAIEDISNQIVIMEGARDTINESVKAVSKEFGIPKKAIRSLAKSEANYSNVKEKRQKTEAEFELQDAYHTIIKKG